MAIAGSKLVDDSAVAPLEPLARTCLFGVRGVGGAAEHLGNGLQMLTAAARPDACVSTVRRRAVLLAPFDTGTPIAGSRAETVTQV